ncbi:VIT1/CCC1 transporter family protein [Flavihumibacter rivuli]|uniref:VIT1/CCC1 transporter family protein n=1 Tax=Flavihumibacter rivuli TaxID=2838156 RepID=UPI001BDEC988|nr:VIT1/CCC1 transporter family protein [Flavihumibacter rivuli]ULQ57156.1 VIT1/CCC1 transporter family protein [Flavihumibacter rivuli]
MAQQDFWIRIINRRGPLLDPVSRTSEIIFGLIMVLTFTCSISAATAMKDDIRTTLWAALGCNVAWGIVDGFMYLMALLIERGDTITAVRTVLQSQDKGEREQVIRDYLPPAIETIIQPGELESISQAVGRLPEPPNKVPITWKDVKAAGAIFLLVFFSTFPPTLPFMLMEDYEKAIRISNAIALLLLFITGYKLGRSSGYRPFPMGLVFALVGALLVASTIALGG